MFLLFNFINFPSPYFFIRLFSVSFPFHWILLLLLLLLRPGRAGSEFHQINGILGLLALLSKDGARDVRPPLLSLSLSLSLNRLHSSVPSPASILSDTRPWRYQLPNTQSILPWKNPAGRGIITAPPPPPPPLHPPPSGYREILVIGRL